MTPRRTTWMTSRRTTRMATWMTTRMTCWRTPRVRGRRAVVPRTWSRPGTSGFFTTHDCVPVRFLIKTF